MPPGLGRLAVASIGAAAEQTSDVAANVSAAATQVSGNVAQAVTGAEGLRSSIQEIASSAADALGLLAERKWDVLIADRALGHARLPKRSRRRPQLAQQRIRQ
jgi:hypothetical protein